MYTWTSHTIAIVADIEVEPRVARDIILKITDVSLQDVGRLEKHVLSWYAE